MSPPRPPNALPAPRRARKADALSKRCTAKSKRSGEQCRAWAMRGLSVCHKHGGATKAAEAKRREVVARHEAEKAVAREIKRLGESIDVHPLDALLDLVHEAAANVAALRLFVGELGIEVDADGGIALPERVLEWEHSGTHVPARQHILVVMYGEERDRLARWAKLCLDAGIDERRVRMQEARGREMAEVVREAIDAMSPTPAQREAGYRAAAEAMRRRTAA